ncbi:hypothetical protein ZIOFF_073052 [Zingiber officinale]|uniref:Deoxyuridine 5'-triphosphate nucleotidohydrolase n=1 Tax=Zingiber officinale TaxID=94328 RepID=A0A8J5EP08_ZINOF|nr:hypothetical protein ZIOFF_073052 [Zingiber officinale]
MQYIQLGVLQVRIQTLHRQEEGNIALIVFHDNRWEGDQAILASMEVDLTRGSQLVYVIPNIMLTVGDIFRNIQVTILTRGYEQWRHERKYSGAVGYDLAASNDCTIPPLGRAQIHTGIGMAIPWGSYGRITLRSSYTWKYGMDIGARVIDCDYRGEIIIVAFNHSDVALVINQGDCIAQLIFERILLPEFIKFTILKKPPGEYKGLGQLIWQSPQHLHHPFFKHYSRKNDI